MGSNSNSLKRREFPAAGETVAAGVTIGGALSGGEIAAVTDSIATLPLATLPRPFSQPPVPIHYWTKGGIIYKSEEMA